MAKHIDQKETEKIVSTLAGWTGPVTWDLIAERCVELLRRKPSRQALARNEDIAIAYDAARSRHKAAVDAAPVDITLEVALQRLDRIEAKLAIAEAKNTKLTERFVVWQYNAYKHGLTQHKLEEALPSVDLDRSDETSNPSR